MTSYNALLGKRFMFHHQIDQHTSLQLIQMTDAEEIFQLVDQSRPVLRQWLPWVDSTQSGEDVAGFIRMAMEQYARNDGFQCVIRHDGHIAGALGLHRIDWNNRYTSLGYWLGQTFHGQGIMTGCCRALVHYLLADLDLNRVEIRAATGNTKSRAIPERLGFTHEGTLREAEWLYDHYEDLAVYSMLKREWNP